MKTRSRSISAPSTNRKSLRIILLVAIACGLSIVTSSTSATSVVRTFVVKAIAIVRGPEKPRPAQRKRNSGRTLPLSFVNTRLLSPIHELLLLPQADEATVSTDKLHYEPGQTVLIKGAGFQANEQVTLQVRHHDR